MKDQTNFEGQATIPIQKLLTDAQEKELVKYLLEASDLYYGLSPQEVRLKECYTVLYNPAPEHRNTVHVFSLAYLCTNTSTILQPGGFCARVGKMRGPDFYFLELDTRHKL